MPLLNYTTTVSVSRSVGEVSGLLVQAGARSVLTRYDAIGAPVGLAFEVETIHGLMAFELPCRAEDVRRVLTREGLQPRYCTPEHASRVAWRILKDWTEAQLAIIQTEMVTLDQVMLPYTRMATGQTLYELVRERGLPQLGMAARND